MATTTPISFTDQVSGVVASYEYNTLAAGFGYSTYYASTSKDTSGTSYNLTTVPDYSYNKTIIDNTAAESTFTSGTIAVPRILKGDIRINVMIRFFVGVSKENRVTLKAYHYDGSTETQLGSTWTSEQWTGGGTIKEALLAVITVSDAVKFKIGDSLRVKIAETGDAFGGVSTCEFGTSPNNLDGTNITPSSNNADFTQFIINVPFRVEV